MPQSSSTSASESPARWLTAVVFAGALLAMLLPFEVLVRRSESVFGTSRAFASNSLSPMPKIDAMQILARRSTQLDVIVVGTSIAEYGIDPRLLQRVVEPGSARPVFNAAVGGVSSIVGLDLAQQFGFRARWVVVSVSPLDFTDTAQKRGNRFIDYARQLRGGAESGGNVRARVERNVGAVVRSVCHASAPLRRRTLTEWLRFVRRSSDVSLLAFLNSPAVVEEQCGTCWDGYVGSTQINRADPRYFHEQTSREPLPVDLVSAQFRAEHRSHVRELEQRITQLRSDGANVLLVRVPTAAGHRDIEDGAAADFTTVMQQLSARAGAPYIDAPVSAAFLRDRANFVDTHHLSYRGSRTHTLALAERVRQLFGTSNAGPTWRQRKTPAPAF